MYTWSFHYIRSWVWLSSVISFSFNSQWLCMKCQTSLLHTLFLNLKLVHTDSHGPPQPWLCQLGQPRPHRASQLASCSNLTAVTSNSPGTYSVAAPTFSRSFAPFLLYGLVLAWLPSMCHQALLHLHHFIMLFWQNFSPAYVQFDYLHLSTSPCLKRNLQPSWSISL